MRNKTCISDSGGHSPLEQKFQGKPSPASWQLIPYFFEVCGEVDRSHQVSAVTGCVTKANRDLSGEKCMAENTLVPVHHYLVSPLPWCPSCVHSRGQPGVLVSFLPAAQWHQGCSHGMWGDDGERGLRFHVSAFSPFLLPFPPLILGSSVLLGEKGGRSGFKGDES